MAMQLRILYTVKFTPQQATKAQRYCSTLSLTSALDGHGRSKPHQTNTTLSVSLIINRPYRCQTWYTATVTLYNSKQIQMFLAYRFHPFTGHEGP